MRRARPAKVVRVDLDRPLSPIAVEPRYDSVLLVVFRSGRAVGEVRLPALEGVPVELQEAAIGRQLGRALWRHELRDRVLTAVGAAAEAVPDPTVSVVVCTRERPEDLERCLTSLLALQPEPAEVLVVDNAPATGATRAVCDRFPFRYLVEPVAGQARARNRGIVESTGELVAFTDDDCVVERAWLAGLGAEFADPRVLAVTGSVAPLELETPAQASFEAHGGFGRGFARRVFDGTRVEPATAAGSAGAGANAIFHRRAFEEVGLFSEWLGPGTPACAADDNDFFCRILERGFSIVYEPGRLVWHRHRRDDEALRKVLSEYAISSTAFATHRLRAERDPAARAIFRWWWLDHLPRELARVVLRRSPVGLRAALAEVSGAVRGPWRSRAARLSRRDVPPIELPPPAPAEPPRLRVTGAELPALSVLMPMADPARSLARVLEGLARQDYPPERFEAIVVLDGAAEAALPRVGELPFPLRVVPRPKQGVAAARNAGVEAARWPIVHFLDDDIVPEPACLSAHADAHARARSSLVVLGYCPPVVDGSWWSQALRAWWEDHYRRKGEPAHRWSYVDFTTGNSSLSRELLRELGGFDTAFVERHEDWELAFRLLGRGVPFQYVPATRAWHYLDLTLASALARQRIEGHADVLIAQRHPAIGIELPLARFGNRPHPSARELRIGLERAEALERQAKRSAWRTHVAALLRDAYAAGLRDAIPDDRAFEGLVATLHAQPTQRVELALDGGEPPPFPAGSLELVLLVAGRACARIAPGPAGEPWDWPAVADRVCRDAATPVLAALVARELEGRAETRAAGPMELAHVG